MELWQQAIKPGDIIIFRENAPMELHEIRNMRRDKCDVYFKTIGNAHPERSYIYQNVPQENRIIWSRFDIRGYDEGWDIVGYIPREKYQKSNSAIITIAEMYK